MMEQDLDDVFFLPLSTQAHEELLQLQSYLEDIEYDGSAADVWSPIWGAKYSSRKFYAHVFSGIEAHPFYKALWKSSCTEDQILCMVNPCGQAIHKDDATKATPQHPR